MLRSFITACALHVVLAKQPDAHYRYVVVGAGPAGLQLGHYLDSAGRSYIVLEQNNASDVQRWGHFGPTPARQKFNSGTDILDLQLKFDDFSLLSEPSHSAMGRDVEGSVSTPALAPCLGLPPAAWKTQVTAGEDEDAPELPLCYTSDFSSSDMRYVSTSSPSRMRVGGGWTSSYHPTAGEVQGYYSYWASEEAPRGVVSHAQPEPAPAATATPSPSKSKGSRESVFDDWEEGEGDGPVGEGEEDLATHTADPTPSPTAKPVVLKRRNLRQQRALHIRYGSKVVRVSRPLGYNSTLWASPQAQAQGEVAAALVKGTPRFKLTTADGQVITCTYLIWAAGLARELPPYGLNISAALAEGVAYSYSTAPREGREYEGKAVLVMGTGPQAQEVASFAVQYASTVHMIGQPVGRIPLQHELPVGSQPPYPHAQVGAAHMGVHGQFLEAALQYTEDAWLAEGLGSRALTLRRSHSSGRVLVTDPVQACVPDVYGRQEVDCLWKREYDMVVVVQGRAWDDRPFKAGGLYLRAAGSDRSGQDGAGNASWPAVGPDYSSAGTPGLYYAGRLAVGEALAGPVGSAAAVRYAARALHRLLEESEQAAYARAAWGGGAGGEVAVGAEGEAQAAGAAAEPLRVDTRGLGTGGTLQELVAPIGQDEVIPAAAWPRRAQCGMRQLVDSLLHRMSLASGLYNMPGALADVLLLHPLDPNQQSLRDYQGLTAVVTPLEEPWSYRRYTCDWQGGRGGGQGGREAAMEDTDSTGYAPYALWFPPWQGPPWAHPDAKEEHPAVVAHAKGENSTQRVVDRGVAGWLLEEVPAAAVASKAWEWAIQALEEQGRHKEAADMASAHELLLATPSHSPLTLPLAHWPEYLTLTLEAGSADGYPAAGHAGWKQELLERTGNGTLDATSRVALESEAGRDPLSAARHNASSSLPWQTLARHPVLRYYHAGLAPRGSAQAKGVGKSRPVVVRNARGETSNIWPLVNGTAGPGTDWSYDEQGALTAQGQGNRTKEEAGNATEPVKLHPAPYSGPLGPPVWECHLKADPHGDYTSHISTVLPLARCLVALATRRVDVAKHLLKNVPELYHKPRKAKNATSTANATSETLVDRAHRLTAGLWTLPLDMEGAQGMPPTGPHAAEIAAIMALPRAVLWFNGHRVQGGRDWWLRMTAAGLARMSGAPLLVLHVLDPWPVELSNREKAFTAAVAQVTHAAGAYERMLSTPRTGPWPKEAILQPVGNGSDSWAWNHSSSGWVTNKTNLPPWTPEAGAPFWHIAQAAQATLAAQPPDPYMSREEVRDAAAEESTREMGYARLTRGAPGAVLISINARSGRERVWAETLRPPLGGIPAFRIYDWRGARMDLPGTMAPGPSGPGAASVTSGFEQVQQAVSQALQALQEGKTVPAKTVQELMREQAGKAKTKSTASSK